MQVSKDLVAASATPLVLAILQEGESYGYAIQKRVAELSGGEFTWTDGMLYPLLHRLERLGYIGARWGVSETGRKRKYYRITPAVLGEGQLAAWKESLGADTAKWWRGHLRALRQNDAAGAKRADSGWGSVERAAVGAAWRIPIPAQVRGMVVGTLEVEWPPRHDSERAATSGPDTGATAAAASSCAPAPDPTS